MSKSKSPKTEKPNASEILAKIANKAILPIIYYPQDEEQLRQKSVEVPVDMITTPAFQRFLDELDTAMRNEPLMPGWIPGGVSAIQVDVPLAVFIAMDEKTESYKYYINPKIEILGSSTDLQLEGCLSFPNTNIKVRRYKRIKVTYYDRKGDLIREKEDGWNARVIQHEFDHLLGILFIDKEA